MRLRKAIEEVSSKVEAAEETSNGLRKQIAILQVSERRLNDTIVKLEQKNNQYFNISMMQLEELASYKLK